jgi:hypothetical protein
MMMYSKSTLFDNNANTAKPFIFLMDTADDNFTDSFENIIQVCKYDSTTDIIATKSRLYSFDHVSETVSQRFSIRDMYVDAEYLTFLVPDDNQFTCMCRLESGYVVVTSKYKFVVIKSFLDSSDMNIQIIVRNGNNGLPTNSSFSFCFPRGGTKVEVDGLNEISCIYDCDKPENASQDAGIIPNGSRVYYYGDSPILFSQVNAYDVSGNVYAIPNGYKYFSYNNLFVFITKGESKIYIVKPLYDYLSFDEHSGVIPDIEYGFAKNEHLYFVNNDNDIIRSYSEDEECPALIYPVSFIFSQDESKDRIKLRKISLNLTNAISIFTGSTDTIFQDINNGEVTYIYIIVSSTDGKTRWYVLGNDNRRDDELRSLYQSFDIGI